MLKIAEKLFNGVSFSKMFAYSHSQHHSPFFRYIACVIAFVLFIGDSFQVIRGITSSDTFGESVIELDEAISEMKSNPLFPMVVF